MYLDEAKYYAKNWNDNCPIGSTVYGVIDSAIRRSTTKSYAWITRIAKRPVPVVMVENSKHPVPVAALTRI